MSLEVQYSTTECTNTAPLVMAYLGFCKTLMGGSRQSRAIFGHFLILSITHKIIVAHLQLAFPSTTHLLHCPILPIWSAKVNTEVHGTEANNKQLQAWEHLPFGRSLQHRTMGSLYVSDPWLKCESFKKTFKTGEETPLTFKREKKRVDLLSLLHDQKKTILGETVAFWKDDIYTKVV